MAKLRIFTIKITNNGRRNTEIAKIFCNFVKDLRPDCSGISKPTMATSAIETIRRRLSAELESMNDIINSALNTDNPLMGKVVRQYLLSKGKQIRPVLVLMSAAMFGKINDNTLHAAASLEMLHNASLIHDDVVDATDMRRGRPTLNKDFDNRIAVLVGDFFVSNALSEAIRTSDIRAISSIAELGKELSLGEIDQISNARECSFDEARYMNVISKKTASLFMKCVRMGAHSTDAAEEDVRNIEKYAELLGLAFQIKDDIFDYFGDEEIGKPTGNDLRENKVSLPLIRAIEVAPKQESDEMRALIAKGNLTDGEIARLIEFAKANGGIEYAYGVMERLRHESETILHTLPANEWRAAFADIFDYTISRHN